MTRFGSDIHQSAFPDDDGSADADLINALRVHQSLQSDITRAAVISTLRHTRLLVPVVADVDSVNADGTEKDSHISAVTFKSNDGRVGLPAFTSIESLKQWNPDARPIPQYAHLVVQSALNDGLDAVLIDMASDHRFALTSGFMKDLLAGL